MNVIAFALLLLPVRYCLERVKPFKQVSRDTGWNQTINRVAKSSDNNYRTVFYNCEHYTEAMFATDCTCYESALADTTMQRLHNAGYRVLEWPRDLSVCGQQGCLDDRE